MSTTILNALPFFLLLIALVLFKIVYDHVLYGNKNDQSRITAIIRDQMQSPYGIVSVARESVLEATYVTATGILQLVLASVHGEGHTVTQFTELRKPVKDKKGNVTGGEPTGGYKQDQYYTEDFQHNMLNVGDVDEQRKIWKWLNNDIDFDKLLQLREEHLKVVADFKAKKKAEAEENLRKANETKEADQSAENDKLVQIVKNKGIPVNSDKGKEITKELKDNPPVPAPVVEMKS